MTIPAFLPYDPPQCLHSLVRIVQQKSFPSKIVCIYCASTQVLFLSLPVAWKEGKMCLYQRLFVVILSQPSLPSSPLTILKKQNLTTTKEELLIMETIMCNQRKTGGIFVQLIFAAHQGRGGHYGNEDENPNGNKIIYRFRKA